MSHKINKQVAKYQTLYDLKLQYFFIEPFLISVFSKKWNYQNFEYEIILFCVAHTALGQIPYANRN